MTQPFGLEKSWDQYDEILFGRKAAEIDCERELFGTKWFDYRFMHPVQATYLYAHHFEVSYREAYSKNFDRATSDYIKPQSKEDLFDCPATFISGIWRGRQVADVLGIPYDFYLRRSMHHTLRYWKRTHLPRPIQLYQDWVIGAIQTDWDEWQEASLPCGEDRKFTVEMFRNTKIQREHREWIASLLRKRPNPRPLIDSFRSRGLIGVEESSIAA